MAYQGPLTDVTVLAPLSSTRLALVPDQAIAIRSFRELRSGFIFRAGVSWTVMSGCNAGAMVAGLVDVAAFVVVFAVAVERRWVARDAADR